MRSDNSRKDEDPMTYAQPMQGYVSARGRATAIWIMVMVQLVMLGLSVLGGVSALSSIGAGGSTALFTAALSGGLAILGGLMMIATFIVFLTWVYRSIANLPALGSMNCRYTPGWAVGWWFIPIANLVHGYKIMATIWEESQPPLVNENGFYLPRKSAIVGWWWALYLMTTVLSWSTRNSNASLHSILTSLTVLSMLEIVQGVLFMIMVRGAQKRQDEMWRDIELRRDVPQPTAQSLR
jgi:hypothetical protein